MNIKYFFIIIIQLSFSLCATENKLNTHIDQSIARRLLRLPRLLAHKESQERVCKKLQQNNLIPGERFIPGIRLFCSLITWAVPKKIDPLETKIRKDTFATQQFIDAIGNHPVQNRRINR